MVFIIVMVMMEVMIVVGTVRVMVALILVVVMVIKMVGIMVLVWVTVIKVIGGAVVANDGHIFGGKMTTILDGGVSTRIV